MGLLDDAIREHLELKRRHGADPAEVARQEDEALGPVRRGEFAQPAEDAGEPAGSDERDADVAADPDAPAAYAASSAPQPDDAWLEDEDAERLGARPAPETDEMPVPEPQPAEPPRGDDVLEGTPDFLEETPEHERLWFEQKPPRDFDFDS